MREEQVNLINSVPTHFAMAASIHNLSASGHAGVRNFGWGPGASGIIDICRESGIRPPVIEEVTGDAVVTFRVNVVGPQQVTAQVTPQVTAAPRIAAQGGQAKALGARS